MRKIRYRFKRNPGCWGMAYPQEWRVELDPALDDKTLLDIAIHEAIHVVAPDLSEEATDRIGRHCGELLWRLGFRREDEGA
jgi:hypothetical protein